MRRRLSQAERKAVYDKYNGHCAYCGCDIPFKGFNVDHLHCLRNYEYTEEFTGIDVHSIDNLMPACHYLKTHKKMKTRAILLLFKQSTAIPFKLLLQAFVGILEVIKIAFETVADLIDDICIFLYEVGT